MLNRTTRSVEPPKEKSAAEKQAEEIEEAKEARAKFVRKGFNNFLKLTPGKLGETQEKQTFLDIHLAKRFRTKRTGEEDPESSEEEEVAEENADVKQELVKTEQRKVIKIFVLVS